MTGDFGTTDAACYRTNLAISGWGCSNCQGRTITVDGTVVTIGQVPLTPAADGYVYFAFTGGMYTYAALYTY